MKKNTIGFKAALNEEEKIVDTAEERQQITSDDLDNIIEERMDRERDYENHMNHYQTLCEKDYKNKNIKNIAIVVIITLIAVFTIKYAYDYVYNKGAYEQCLNNGPYVKIIDNNNNSYIIKK